MNTSGQHILKKLSEQLNYKINSVGINYKIFGRVKTPESISDKFKRKKDEGKEYKFGGHLIQDFIGIRIVTYFKDDIEIVKKIIENTFKIKDESIDLEDKFIFKPKRHNLIINLPSDLSLMLKSEIEANQTFNYLDDTFELQLRTVMSEGWHEIDHSLRYKCKNDWNDFFENERMFNGIFANVETNDIVLKNLFNELAYKHYKNKNWEGMLRTKLRLKFLNIKIPKELNDILNDNVDLSKEIFRISRDEIMNILINTKFTIPICFENVLFLINKEILKSPILNNYFSKDNFFKPMLDR